MSSAKLNSACSSPISSAKFEEEKADAVEQMRYTPDANTDIQLADGLMYLRALETNSVDLVLTDPPYIISRNSGMNAHFNAVKANAALATDGGAAPDVKTLDEWRAFAAESGGAIDIDDIAARDRFLKYGTIYGKKYCVQTDYGEWDRTFTMETLAAFVAEYYRVLKPGGTAIIFFDLWKITALKDLMELCKFKQIRMIEWIKTNPQPLNSHTNYLTNCREIALTGVKRGKPTFNSSYDTGIYRHPIQGGKHRCHPTQKSLLLFIELIEKHSNENDVVLDTFLGSGTTAIAAKRTSRKFKGCEVSPEYFHKAVEHLSLSRAEPPDICLTPHL